MGLLSSIFAKIQGMVFPASMQLFNQVKWTSSDIIQLFIKLVCVYLSCIVGGIVTAVFGGGTKEHYIAGVSMMLIVAWLWISTIYPSWFWASLLIGILPFVLTGGYLKQIITVKKEE